MKSIGEITSANAVVDREAIYPSQAVPNCVFWYLETVFDCDILLKAVLVLN